MALLPWDDWFYHLDHKRHEVNSLHGEAVALQNQVQSQIQTFNQRLKEYKSIIAINDTLVIIGNIIQMKDLKFKDFMVELDAHPKPVTGSVPLEIAGAISEIFGSGLLLRGLTQLGKLAKKFFTSGEEGGEALSEASAEELSEVTAESGIEATSADLSSLSSEEIGEEIGEAAAEEAIEGATLSSLASTGIGIFAAVGIDAIFGAINGAKERDELDAEISKLKKAVKKVQSYYNTVMSKEAVIEAGIVKEMKRFKSIVTDLKNIAGVEPSFEIDFTPTVANYSKFKTAGHAAVSQYGPFIAIRNHWVEYQENDPDATEDEFVNAYAPFSDLTKKQIREYWDVLTKNSDSMRKASKASSA